MTLTDDPTGPRPGRATPVDVRTAPPSGSTLAVQAGTCLELQLGRSVGGGVWRVEERPPYLVPLTESADGVLLLVFSADGAPACDLRLARRRSGRSWASQEHTLRVVVAD